MYMPEYYEEIDKQQQARWDAIAYIIKHAQPHGMEVECLDHFIDEITSPDFMGNYDKAARDSLYEWDI